MRGFRPLLPAVAAAALLAGCGGATDTGASGGNTSAAGIVPASAPAFIAVNTDLESSQWDAAERLGKAFPDESYALDRLRVELSHKGLDWKRDVAPALGPEVDVAVLDFRAQTDIVGLVKPDDQDAFDRLVKKANADAEKPSDKLYTREVDGWQVVADAPAKLDRFEQLRDQSAKRLADSDAYNAAVAASPHDVLARAYLDGARATAALRRVMPAEALAQFQRLGKLDWLLATARAEEQGVRLVGAVHGTPGPAFVEAGAGKPFTPTLPQHVPAGVVAYYAFHGSNAATAQLNLGGSGMLGMPLVTEALRQLQPILRGENALYVRAGKPFPEVTLVAQPGAGVNGTQRVDRALSRLGPFVPARPRPLRIAGHSGRALRLGPVSVYYVTVGGRLLLSDSRAGIESFLGGGGRKLADDPAFRSSLAAADVGTKTLGYLYVNLPRTFDLVQQFTGAFPPIVARNLAPLRSLVEDVRTQPHEAHVSLFLEIRR